MTVRSGEKGTRKASSTGLAKQFKKSAACPGPCVMQYVKNIKGKEKTSKSERKQIIQKGKMLQRQQTSQQPKDHGETFKVLKKLTYYISS